MNAPESFPSREDVLSAYAVEADHDRTTLERYLREYPQYADDLVDLSHDLAQHIDVSTAPLSAGEETLISAAWQQFAAAGQRPLADPMARLTVPELRTIAQKLGVPRQILAAFRERRVILSSVPRTFLARLASLIGTPLEEFHNMLARAPTMEMARSYKADQKPSADAPVTFEQLLTDAGVPADQRAALLKEAV
jgi:signal transduction histidine kinase